MTLKDYALVVQRVLELQARYSRTRDLADLEASKKAEAELRELTREILDPRERGLLDRPED